MLRFYAQGAPRWWPYQLVSLANERLPPRSGRYYLLIDNGMYGYYKQRQRPSLDLWYARLVSFVWRAQKIADEIMLVLPDWLNDFDFTLEAARHPVAKKICKDYKCMAVVHIRKRKQWGETYDYAAGILAYIDHVAALAAPLKLTCLRYDPRGKRHIVDRRGLVCQLSIIRQVCSVARRHGLACHGLGLVLEPRHVRRTIELGLGSFDSTSWTRPNKTLIRRYAPQLLEQIEHGEVGAKTLEQKGIFLLIKIRQLLYAGVPLELPQFPLELVTKVW